jgi:hypothetical protein
MTDNSNLENNDAGGVEPEYVIPEELTDLKPLGLPGTWTAGRLEPVVRPVKLDQEAPLDAEIRKKKNGGVFRFGELMKSQVERPREIVKGLICQRQNVILIGRFGIGKTMLGTQLSVHLAIGREFLGLSVPRAIRTMYLDFENDLGDMKDRFSKQTAAFEDQRELLDKNLIYVDAGDDETLLHGIKLDDGKRDKFDVLVNELNKHKTEVLFIDNLGLVATNGDLTDPEETARFYENLKYIRSKTESLRDGAIVIFHHLTKPSEYQSSISLLTSPYEYLSRARGSGRILDFARSRLALAEETIGEKKCHVLNGVNRSAQISPLILQFNAETLSFERHKDTRLRFDAVFGNRPKGREIYKLLPDEFKFTEAENIKDPNGKQINKGTLSETLKVAVENDLIRHNASSGIYTKIYDPQSD